MLSQRPSQVGLFKPSESVSKDKPRSVSLVRPRHSLVYQISRPSRRERRRRDEVCVSFPGAPHTPKTQVPRRAHTLIMLIVIRSRIVSFGRSAICADQINQLQLSRLRRTQIRFVFELTMRLVTTWDAVDETIQTADTREYAAFCCAAS